MGMMTHGSQGLRNPLALLAIAVALSGLSSCAQKGAPDGGPPDTTAPTILSTTPEAAAVKVPRDTPIEIEFSEPVDKEKLLANLYISPRREGQLEQKWSGHSVRLIWSDSLRADVTYRVTVGAKLTDRHNNPLTDAHTFAFATGLQIDSGRIAGGVWDGVSAAGAVDIFAYPLGDTGEWNPADVGFQTQTGADGHFDLPYLPTERFRVLAVVDKNNNNRPDAGEAVGIAARDVDAVTSGATTPLRLFTHVYDTSLFALTGCTESPDGSILIGLNHPADTVGWRAPSFQLRDSTSGEQLNLTVMRPLPPNLTVIPALGDGLREDRTYEIRFEDSAASTAFDATRKPLSSGSCYLTYTPVVDTVGPRVQWTWFPEAGRALQLGAPIEFGFSEPIDTTRLAGGVHVFDTTGVVIDGSVSFPDPRRVVFRPDSPWPEMPVIVTLDSSGLVDRWGNPASSQRFTWPVKPLTDEALGFVDCRVEPPTGDVTADRVVIWAVAAHGALRTEHADSTYGTVTLALPAGNWLLGAFLDSDHDGRYSPGSLNPYRPSELQTILSDTVSVRARFTVEDIVIRF